MAEMSDVSAAAAATTAPWLSVMTMVVPSRMSGVPFHHGHGAPRVSLTLMIRAHGAGMPIMPAATRRQMSPEPSARKTLSPGTRRRPPR